MGFVSTCVQDSMPIWEQCLDSEFLRGMEAGTLSADCFAGYIVDDSLYLREYGRVFASAIVKAKTLDEMRTYYSFLTFINDGEGTTRVQYLLNMGLSENAIEQLPQRPENRAYTQYMLRAVEEGDIGPECMMAGLPCMLSYAWIFHTMVQRSPNVLNGPFGPMIRDYVVENSDAICQEWVQYADKICQDLTAEQMQRCLEIFRGSSLHELNFWNMSAQPRDDIQHAELIFQP